METVGQPPDSPSSACHFKLASKVRSIDGNIGSSKTSSPSKINPALIPARSAISSGGFSALDRQLGLSLADSPSPSCSSKLAARVKSIDGNILLARQNPSQMSYAAPNADPTTEHVQVIMDHSSVSAKQIPRVSSDSVTGSVLSTYSSCAPPVAVNEAISTLGTLASKEVTPSSEALPSTTSGPLTETGRPLTSASQLPTGLMQGRKVLNP